ncbi:hypothetical protein LTS12_027255, partial [Elasticomyces elasticus]
MAPSIPETGSEIAEDGDEKFYSISCAVDLGTANPGISISSAGVVTWRDDSPDHPRNWTTARKSYDIVVVGMLEFFT